MATELNAVREAMLHAHDVLHNARSMLPESDAGHAEIGEAMRGLRDAAALAAPPVEQQAARATVYIQRDHLEKAKRAPFLCRVEPTQRLPDFVPMHPTEQPSQDAAWQKIGDEVTLILSDPDSELSDGAKRALEWIAEVAGARAAQAQGESKRGTPHG